MTTMMSNRGTDHSSMLDNGADVNRFRQFIEQAGRELASAQVVLLSTMPRGGLQIVQPQRLSEAWLKTYARDLHPLDRTTWSAITTGQAVRGSDVWGDGFSDSAYARQLLVPQGLRYEAAAAVEAPVLVGFPGALHVYRTEEQGDFSNEDLRRIEQLAGQIAAAAARMRRQRLEAPAPEPLAHEAPLKFLAFDRKLQQLMPAPGPLFTDERLHHNVLEAVRGRFEQAKRKHHQGERVQVPDARADLWNFRANLFTDYPALSDGPVVFFCLQPSCRDWGTLQPSDFQADRELARLIPAMRFMQDQFHRGPTLVEIARTVHLSPFHFHRRFTELLGITPKHFMLDCQIGEAKRMLLARQRDLVDIAKECGFAHQSHFTSRFKQATGLTPTRWRRAALEAQKAAK